MMDEEITGQFKHKVCLNICWGRELKVGYGYVTYPGLPVLIDKSADTLGAEQQSAREVGWGLAKPFARAPSSWLVVSPSSQRAGVAFRLVVACKIIIRDPIYVV